MQTLVAITLGGMLGAYARYRVTAWIDARAGRGFPWGTLAVNAAGSFALGLALPQLAGGASPLRAFVTVGFLGAFTTFSTFAGDTLRLTRDGRRGRAAAFVGASLALGLAAIVSGLWLGARIG